MKNFGWLKDAWFPIGLSILGLVGSVYDAIEAGKVKEREEEIIENQEKIREGQKELKETLENM